MGECMEEERIAALALRVDDPRREGMKTPEEVAVMLRLKGLGWGSKRIGREFGCSHHPVKRYMEVGGFVAYRQPRRPRTLDGLEEWLKERFRRHRGNADVMRRSWRRRRSSSFRCARWSRRWPAIAKSSWQRPAPRCGLRRRRVGRCKADFP
jgi:hypothetical protein